MITKIITIMLLLSLLAGPALAAEDITAPTFTANIKPDGDSVRVYGTVKDVPQGNITASGVDRLELKFDGDQWTTATISGMDYTYTTTLEQSGHHVVQIRAIDKANNPSDIEVRSYTADFSETSSLSDYVSIKSAQFRTLDDLKFITKIDEGKDIGVIFDIFNDAEEDIRVRVTISTGTYETEDDFIIESGEDESVSEWIPGVVLSTGMHEFDIEVMDLDTHKTLDDKTLQLTVIESTTTVSADADTGPTDEFIIFMTEFAELNDLQVPGQAVDDTQFAATIAEMNATIAAQNALIVDLRGDFNDYKSSQNDNSNTQVKSSMFDGVSGTTVVIVVLLILGYLFRDKISMYMRKEEYYDPEEERHLPEPETPRPQ